MDVSATQYGYWPEEDVGHQIAPFWHGHVGKRGWQETEKVHGDAIRGPGGMIGSWVFLLHWNSIGDGRQRPQAWVCAAVGVGPGMITRYQFSSP